MGKYDPYYRIINEEVKHRLGGLHSGKIILYSVEFDEIERCQSNNEWEKSGEISYQACGASWDKIYHDPGLL